MKIWAVLKFYFLCMFSFFPGVITGVILMRQTSNCFFLIISLDGIFIFLWVSRLRKCFRSDKGSMLETLASLCFHGGNLTHYLVWYLIIYFQKFQHSDWQRGCELIPNSAKSWIFLSAESWNWNMTGTLKRSNKKTKWRTGLLRATTS